MTGSGARLFNLSSSLWIHLGMGEKSLLIAYFEFLRIQEGSEFLQQFSLMRLLSFDQIVKFCSKLLYGALLSGHRDLQSGEGASQIIGRLCCCGGPVEKLNLLIVVQ